MSILATLPARDCPTERIPVTVHSETDLLAFDLRNVADRVERLRFDGPENPAALLREIADAVERARP